MNDISEFLSLSTLCLSTCGREGLPHSAPVYFVADGDNWMYFYSKPSSQHIQNILENPKAALSIYPECFDWHEIRGIQMRGAVEEVQSPEIQKEVLNEYKKKFPFVTKTGVSLSDNQLYVFRANWGRVTDNRVRFGYKKEIEFEPNIGK